MYVLFFTLWVVFNGAITLEIVLFGLMIAAAMYWFICKYMDYKVRTDIKICKNIFRGITYLFVLIWEIMKANFIVMKLILTSKYEVEPVLVTFKTDLKSEAAKVALANSITLTPGTITVQLEEDEYCVHCLDKDLAENIDNSVFVKLLRKMDGK